MAILWFLLGTLAGTVWTVFLLLWGSKRLECDVARRFSELQWSHFLGILFATYLPDC
jgi:hypothetical protein